LINQEIPMNRSERLARLKEMLKDLAPERDPANLRTQNQEGMGFEATGETIVANSGLEKVATDKEPDEMEMRGMEAIIMPRERPVVFVKGDIFDPIEAPWEHLNTDVIRGRFKKLIPSIGRIELPNSLFIPFGGTGFVVGKNLLMTNRHVAGLFSQGLGRKNLVYHAGDAAIDFKREVDMPEDAGQLIQVVKVLMVHPFWDMAILQVTGLPESSEPLVLFTDDPAGMLDAEVAAVGYPARDDRNDLAIQDRIFQRKYNVKRFQPGKLRERRTIRSFSSNVNAVTHNCSTLGGNSGSAVLDIKSGKVIALHFGGEYLKANYGVPAFELARDSRVVDLGVNFAGKLPTTTDFDGAWAGLESIIDGNAPPVLGPGGVAPSPVPVPVPAPSSMGAGKTWTIPLNVTITFGAPVVGGPAPAPVVMLAPDQAALPPVSVETMQVPVRHGRLGTRRGYQSDFLELDSGDNVELPKLTAAGENAVARLSDQSWVLKYHKFSVVMHKSRRMALFTAANVNWDPSTRLVNGKKPTRRELTGLADGVQEKWVTDPRIPEENQLPDIFYTKDDANFDKGHLVRRDDVCWGSSFDDIQKANGDTYHTTNCTPQVAKFNRSAGGVDNWGDLENLVQKETKAEKVCLFSGPVLSDSDRFFHGKDDDGPASVRIPRAFWKIIVSSNQGSPAAFGFFLEQDLGDVPLHEEFIVPPAWKRYMKKISEIEVELGGLLNLSWFAKHDQFAAAQPLAKQVQKGR
jgi:endonuclease G